MGRKMPFMDGHYLTEKEMDMGFELGSRRGIYIDISR